MACQFAGLEISGSTGLFRVSRPRSFGSPRNTFFRARNFIFFNRCVLSEDAGFGKQYYRNLVGEVINNWRQIPHNRMGSATFCNYCGV